MPYNRDVHVLILLTAGFDTITDEQVKFYTLRTLELCHCTEHLIARYKSNANKDKLAMVCFRIIDKLYSTWNVGTVKLAQFLKEMGVHIEPSNIFNAFNKIESIVINTTKGQFTPVQGFREGEELSYVETWRFQQACEVRPAGYDGHLSEEVTKSVSDHLEAQRLFASIADIAFPTGRDFYFRSSAEVSPALRELHAMTAAYSRADPVFYGILSEFCVRNFSAKPPAEFAPLCLNSRASVEELASIRVSMVASYSKYIEGKVEELALQGVALMQAVTSHVSVADAKQLEVDAHAGKMLICKEVIHAVDSIHPGCAARSFEIYNAMFYTTLKLLGYMIEVERNFKLTPVNVKTKKVDIMAASPGSKVPLGSTFGVYPASEDLPASTSAAFKKPAPKLVPASESAVPASVVVDDAMVVEAFGIAVSPSAAVGLSVLFPVVAALTPGSGRPAALDFTCREQMPVGLACSEQMPVDLACREQMPVGLACSEQMPVDLACTEEMPVDLACTEEMPFDLACREEMP